MPAGWETTRNPARGALHAIPPDGAGEATNLSVVTVTDPASGDDPDDYATLAVRELAEALTDAVILSVHVGPAPDRMVDVLVAHEVLGRDVTTVQRHLLGPPATAVVATGSTDDRRWPDRSGELTAAVRSLRVDW